MFAVDNLSPGSRTPRSPRAEHLAAEARANPLAMTCLLDREAYRRWERYFNGNGLPLPAHYEMRDDTPAPRPRRPQAARAPRKKPRQEPAKNKVDRLAKLWTEAEEAEEATRPEWPRREH